MNTDPSGLDATTAFGGILYQSWQGITGNGFDYSSISGAFRDGYNGQGSFNSSAANITWSAGNDLLNFGTLGLGSLAKNSIQLGIREVGNVINATRIVLPEFKATRSVDQYALIAQRNGFYPVMKRGFKEPQGGTWLNAGEVWKYGTTVNPSTRYLGVLLNNTGKGLRYDQMMSGTLPQALSAEKVAIQNYRQMFGKLPPGNKMVK